MIKGNKCPELLKWELRLKDHSFYDRDVDDGGLKEFAAYVLAESCPDKPLKLSDGSVSIRGTLYYPDRNAAGDDMEIFSIVEVCGNTVTAADKMTPLGRNRGFMVTTRAGSRYCIELVSANHASLYTIGRHYDIIHERPRYARLRDWGLAVDCKNGHMSLSARYHLNQFVKFIENGLYAIDVPKLEYDIPELEIPARCGIRLNGYIWSYHPKHNHGEVIQTSPIVYVRSELPGESGTETRYHRSHNEEDGSFHADWRWVAVTESGSEYRIWEIDRIRSWNDPLLVH